MKVNLVKQMKHVRSLFWLPVCLTMTISSEKYRIIHTSSGIQNWSNIEIFMHIYEGNLLELIKRERLKGPDVLRATRRRMLHQISNALHFVHTRNSLIIHRDVKPPNILFQGDNFYLTDFGIAKPVDTSRTVVGTR